MLNYLDMAARNDDTYLFVSGYLLFPEANDPLACLPMMLLSLFGMYCHGNAAILIF